MGEPYLLSHSHLYNAWTSLGFKYNRGNSGNMRWGTSTTKKGQPCGGTIILDLWGSKVVSKLSTFIEEYNNPLL